MFPTLINKSCTSSSIFNWRFKFKWNFSVAQLETGCDNIALNKSHKFSLNLQFRNLFCFIISRVIIRMFSEIKKWVMGFCTALMCVCVSACVCVCVCVKRRVCFCVLHLLKVYLDFPSLYFFFLLYLSPYNESNNVVGV